MEDELLQQHELVALTPRLFWFVRALIAECKGFSNPPVCLLWRPLASLYVSAFGGEFYIAMHSKYGDFTTTREVLYCSSPFYNEVYRRCSMILMIETRSLCMIRRPVDVLA